MCEISKDDLADFLGSEVCLTDTQLEIAIGSAGDMIEKALESCMMGYSDDKIKRITLYLAAHYSVPFDQTLSMKSYKDACSNSSATFTTSAGDGVESTTFGNTANQLSCGCLAELGKDPICFFSLGVDSDIFDKGLSKGFKK